ncbi:hypothetical protein AVEN_6862-1 [Araneus ventricosus]|uniref:Uncharacterized protein n=1 Tax=Araneus ventricosus TaxID=182803 RepID=A0A4Y2D6Q1_ARAVE|nr:hypothetical protein AVEN_313-1 [Araneus ventricosus]GBM12400.1 hypothetical protein AVEN_6862-1 [Araneus ventricosus]
MQKNEHLFDCDFQHSLWRRETRAKREKTTLRTKYYDGAPMRKISNVKQYLMETFQNQVIGYGGFIVWPPHSSDWTSSYGTHKRAGICDPSDNIAGCSTSHY